MEVGAILIVPKAFVQFLIPYDSATPVDIDHFEEEGISYEVVGEHDSAREAGVGPLAWIGICYIQSGDRCGLYLVGAGGDGALDAVLVLPGQQG